MVACGFGVLHGGGGGGGGVLCQTLDWISVVGFKGCLNMHLLRIVTSPSCACFCVN